MWIRSSPGTIAFLLLLVAGAISGCGYVGMDAPTPAEQGAIDLVARTLQPNIKGWLLIEFHLGEFEGGCAVCVHNSELEGVHHTFWVQNGVVYAVDDAAKQLAPQQPVAPPSVTYEKAAAVVH